MDQRIRRLIAMSAVALICLVLVTTPVPAQQSDPLQAAVNALGAHRVTTLHLKGFGTAYSVASAPQDAWVRVPLESYEADVDFTRDAMHVRISTEAGQPLPEASRSTQHVWATPQGFLRAARGAKARVRAVPQGTEVSFSTNGQAFIGLINARYEVDRVQTWVDGQGRGDAFVETLFRDYEKTASGVRFPTHITQNHGKYPSIDVWLSTVAVNVK